MYCSSQNVVDTSAGLFLCRPMAFLVGFDRLDPLSLMCARRKAVCAVTAICDDRLLASEAAVTV